MNHNYTSKREEDLIKETVLNLKKCLELIEEREKNQIPFKDKESFMKLFDLVSSIFYAYDDQDVIDLSDGKYFG